MKLHEAIAELMVSRIQKRVWRPEERLPTVDALAARFGVSRTTILQTLRILLRKNWIRKASAGRGFVVTGGLVEAPVAIERIASRHRYREIAQILEREIWQGRYGWDGALPPTSTLLQRFGGHGTTLGRALALLAREGLVERRARRYRLVSRSPLREASVYLTGTALAESWNPFHAAMIRAAEEELALMGWGRLERFITDDPFAAIQPEPGSVAGFLHITHGRDDAWNRFFESRSASPLAIVSFTEQAQPLLERTSRYFLFHPDNRKAGRSVAGHLAALGHRQVAFFTHAAPKLDWARLRLLGLQDVLSIASSESDGVRGVTVFATESLQYAPSKHPVPLQASGLQALSREAFAGILPGLWERHGREQYDRTRLMADMVPELRRLFEAAFAQRDAITAWVCANDEVALLAQQFLSERSGGSAPIPVIGFDNSHLTFLTGLTSYDFGFARFGHAAIRALASPRASEGTGPVREAIEGRLVERGVFPRRHSDAARHGAGYGGSITTGAPRPKPSARRK